MLKELIDTEIKYTKNFSQTLDQGNVIRFWDDSLPDMYAHNFILIKNDIDTRQLILKEMEQRRSLGKEFLRVEMNFPMGEDILKGLPTTPEVTRYDYMIIMTDQYRLLKGNADCTVKEAKTPEVLRDGSQVDILANQRAMGMEFAQKRIHRKSQVYASEKSPINLFVCYHQGIPIGNCELMVDGEIAKIEDFDILESYQRKGFGTSVLKHLLMQAEQLGAKWAYLITDHSDTAKDMYTKCGFERIGEKTELFFNLTQL